MSDNVCPVNSNIQVLDRALYVLDILAAEGKPMNATDIATRTELNRSTVHRILEALSLHGYLDKNEHGLYKMGMKVVAMAGNYINSLELITISQPHLWDLTYSLDLSSYMAILSEKDVVYVAHADPYRRSSVYMEIGWRAPAYATAHGMCLLSQFSSDVFDAYFANFSFKKLAKNTITNVHELKQELRKVRTHGYFD